MVEKLNKCVWMWAGLLTYRLCDRGYQCTGCPVEVLFHPKGSLVEQPGQGVVNAPDRVQGSFAASPDRFHDSQHLWLRVLPEGRLQVGLDPMAARLLESADGLELPRVGGRLRRGEEAATLTVQGKAVRFSSPVTGDILRVHQIPTSRLRSMLTRPYTRAWLLVMSVPRLERQLARYLFGRGVAHRLTQDWSRFQEECVSLAAGPQVSAPVLPDGGEVDLERLRSWAGPEYPTLIGRWIGTGRARGGRAAARLLEERPDNQDGTSLPPLER
jgi:glycine cleavage system H lipoate-binding protein